MHHAAPARRDPHPRTAPSPRARSRAADGRRRHPRLPPGQAQGRRSASASTTTPRCRATARSRTRCANTSACSSGDAHAGGLRARREAALRALEFFATFEPRLVGPVLDGTADAHSPVTPAPVQRRRRRGAALPRRARHPGRSAQPPPAPGPRAQRRLPGLGVQRRGPRLRPHRAAARRAAPGAAVEHRREADEARVAARSCGSCWRSTRLPVTNGDADASQRDAHVAGACQRKRPASRGVSASSAHARSALVERRRSRACRRRCRSGAGGRSCSPGSFCCSSQCATQPAVRAIANITVNISVGISSAL